MRGFGTRVAEAVDARGHLCAGIDPHPGLLREWGLADDAKGLARFTQIAFDAFSPVAAILKPQSAFFERHGSAGIAVLEEFLGNARETGTLTLLDVKRGDIGTTMAAYAEAYLGATSPLRADAITVSPYLGFGTVAPAVETALANGRGLFALCLTSNPEGHQVQGARLDGVAVAAAVARAAGEVNEMAISQGERWGSVGLVVGATVGTAREELGVELEHFMGPILAPGFGAQGAGPEAIEAVFGAAKARVLASSSRSLLEAGPDPASLRNAALQLGREVNRAINAV